VGGQESVEVSSTTPSWSPHSSARGQDTSTSRRLASRCEEVSRLGWCRGRGTRSEERGLWAVGREVGNGEFQPRGGRVKMRLSAREAWGLLYNLRGSYHSHIFPSLAFLCHVLLSPLTTVERPASMSGTAKHTCSSPASTPATCSRLLTVWRPILSLMMSLTATCVDCCSRLLGDGVRIGRAGEIHDLDVHTQSKDRVKVSSV
jgi:hypothetical protein